MAVAEAAEVSNFGVCYLFDEVDCECKGRRGAEVRRETGVLPSQVWLLHPLARCSSANIGQVPTQPRGASRR